MKTRSSQKAFDELKRLGGMLPSFMQVMADIQEVGSIEQMASEAEKRRDAAVRAADKAMADVEAIKKSGETELAAATAEATKVREDAQNYAAERKAKADSGIAEADQAAKGIVAKATEEAEKIVADARAEAKDITDGLAASRAKLASLNDQISAAEAQLKTVTDQVSEIDNQRKKILEKLSA